MSTPYEDAAMLLASLDPSEARALLHQHRLSKARADELAKDHPMKAYRLDADQWAQFKAYLLDGGGVEEDTQLATDIFQAIFDDNQEAFWNEVFHLVKARAKINGVMRPLPFGGVSFTGVGERASGPMQQIIGPVPEASGEGNTQEKTA